MAEGDAEKKGIGKGFAFRGALVPWW